MSATRRRWALRASARSCGVGRSCARCAAPEATRIEGADPVRKKIHPGSSATMAWGLNPAIAA